MVARNHGAASGWLLVLGAVLAGTGAALAQTPIAVTSLVDGQPGSLRAALTAAAGQPIPAIVELQVAGACVLNPTLGSLPAIPAGAIVRAPGFTPGQRFTINAQNFTVGITALRATGAGARVTAPLTILVNTGAGVVVSANDVQFGDLEIVGGSSWSFRAASVSNLVVDRLVVRQGGVGVSLWTCTNSRLGNAALGRPVRATQCLAQPLQIQRCTDLTVECFEVEDNVGTVVVPGIHMQDNTRVRLGSPLRRSTLSRNSAGAKLERCVDCRVADVDILQSGQVGFWIDAGSGNQLAAALIDSPAQIGVQLSGNTAAPRVGPGVTIRNVAGSFGAGVAINNCSAPVLQSVHVQRCTPGVNAGQNTVNALIDGCHLQDCQRGLLGVRAPGMRVQNSRFEHNSVRGVELDACTDMVTTGSVFVNNFGPGLEAVNGSHRLVFGPGNTVEGNGFIGVSFRDSSDCTVRDNPSISHNAGVGVESARSRRLSIARNHIEGNLGSGIWLLFDSSSALVGPGNVVTGTFGSGIKIELCDAALVVGNHVHDNYGTGVVFIDQWTTANAGHVMRSTLVADNRDLGVMLRSGNPVSVQASTIVGNYRGLDATSGLAVPAQIDVDSSIIWGNWLDDYNNATMSSGLVVAQHSTVQFPAPGGNNNSLDPRFVDAVNGDYRLRSDSPMIDAANQPRYLTVPGLERDAQGGDRFVGCAVDRGACELQRIAVTSSQSSTADITLQWPGSAQGGLSILLFSKAQPTGGVLPCSTFTWDLFTFQQFAFTEYTPGIIATVPPGGRVQAAIPLLPGTVGPVWAGGFLFTNQGGGLAFHISSGVAQVPGL